MQKLQADLLIFASLALHDVTLGLKCICKVFGFVWVYHIVTALFAPIEISIALC